MQNGWSRKIYLELTAPSMEDNRPDRERILDALARTEGLKGMRIRMSAGVMREIYPLCQEAEWKITATLGFDGDGFTVIRLEAGNTEGEHYGLCADLGSTTIAMQLVDMTDGSVKAETSVFNPQIAFGEDILTLDFLYQRSSGAVGATAFGHNIWFYRTFRASQPDGRDSGRTLCRSDYCRKYCNDSFSAGPGRLCCLSGSLCSSHSESGGICWKRAWNRHRRFCVLLSRSGQLSGRRYSKRSNFCGNSRGG